MTTLHPPLNSLHTMKKLNTLLLTLCLTGLSPKAHAQQTRTLYVPKAGTMVELLTEEEARQITHLRLQGHLNAIDFRHLRDEFDQLEVLDLSGASISTYAGKHGTHPDKFYLYPANCIPAYAFCRRTTDSTWVGKHTLCHVILSDKTKNIEDAAFKLCTSLHVCEIRCKKAPNLFPEALADSVTAIFVPAGSSDAYRTKKRWETFAFIEGTPLRAKVEIGATGSLASELIRIGVHPKEVNFLTVSGKLDENDFKLIRDYMPNLVSADLSESNATEIPAYTFTQKKYLLRVQLPKGVERIGERAFSGCGRLCGTLNLPSGVTAIEYGAFIGCYNLRHVLAHGNITTLGHALFGEETDKLIYSDK